MPVSITSGDEAVSITEERDRNSTNEMASAMVESAVKKYDHFARLLPPIALNLTRPRTHRGLFMCHWKDGSLNQLSNLLRRTALLKGHTLTQRTSELEGRFGLT